MNSSPQFSHKITSVNSVVQVYFYSIYTVTLVLIVTLAKKINASNYKTVLLTCFISHLIYRIPPECKACLSVIGRVIIYSFNLNTSPKMSYGVLECDIAMLQNNMLMIL